MMPVPLRPWLWLCCSVVLLNPVSGLPATPVAGFAFRTNDVVALVGGEEMVALPQHGYLETLLTAAWPGRTLRFRGLAFEGDTVFEQPRQLHFPSWEQQLDRVGATVVLVQFGQAEALRGATNVSAFAAAAGKLLDRDRKSTRLNSSHRT